MQPGHAQLRNQRTRIQGDFSPQLAFRAGRVMPIQQDKTVTCMCTRRGLREGQYFLVCILGLNKSALLSKRLRHQRLHVGGVFVLGQQNAGVGLNLLQVTHAQVIPRVSVSRI